MVVQWLRLGVFPAMGPALVGKLRSHKLFVEGREGRRVGRKKEGKKWFLFKMAT